MAIEGAPSYAALQREMARLEAELAEAQKREAEVSARETAAREHQTATAEVLRLIAGSPTDLQAVLRAVGERAARLCHAPGVFVYLVERDHLVRVASTGLVAPVESNVPRPLDRTWVAGQAVLDRRTVHVHDVTALPEAAYPLTREMQRRFGFRTVLATPLVREGAVVGAISMARVEVRPFSEQQIQLLETFGDQAVIAIENARLFRDLEDRNRELSEALEQQTATGEILRVIASSPADLDRGLEVIVETAARLCQTDGGTIQEVRARDGLLVGRAWAGLQRKRVEQLRCEDPTWTFDTAEGLPATAESAAGRAFVERRTVLVDDMAEAAKAEYPGSRSAQQRIGHRTVVAVPLRREETPIGVLTLQRHRVQPFTGQQIALVETFADQAVIAIENARLFRDLTEALERQTATSEVLKVISRSAFDLQPVLDTLVENAARLCRADFGVIRRFDGEVFQWAADFGASAEWSAYLQGHPVRPGRGSGFGRAALEHRTIHIPDVLADPEYELSEYQRRFGYRTTLSVPLLREGNLVGVASLARTRVEPFTGKQIELVETFADQAVIAIENTRLFSELQGRVEELQALGEVGQAVSSTLDLERVLDTIVAQAVELADAESGAIYEYEEATEQFQLRATRRLPEAVTRAGMAAPMRLSEGVIGEAAAKRAPVQVPDIKARGAYTFRLRGVLLRSGFRAILGVPLLREGRVLGGLVLLRKAPGAFAPGVIELMQTFASQSALAMQNARLFRELEETSAQLATASRHKSEFLANMSHELRTPLNAINGFSEVLLERYFGELNDKQEEYLRDIAGSGQHLLSLINDILDLSKVEAGRMELEVGEFSLREALQNGLTMLRERANRHGIALSLEVEDGLDGIEADERKVKQVVFNLLSNAVKFTPDGGRVEVTAGQADGEVVIAVRDTGVGISPEDLPHIFEEFRQVSTGTAKAEGTGLGLALAKRFVELHGGSIRVESAPGAGTTFTLTLPQPAGLVHYRDERAGVEVRQGPTDAG